MEQSKAHGDQSPGADKTGASTTPRVRCVLLCAPGAPGVSQVPAELRAALDRKGVDLEAAAGVFDATARLAVPTKGESLKGAAGSSQPVALLLVEPDRFPRGRAGELARACSVYLPHAVVWVWRKGQEPPLQAFRIEETPRASAPTVSVDVVVSTPLVSASAGPLRLVGHERDDHESHTNPLEKTDGNFPKGLSGGLGLGMSPEELRVLLGEEDSP